VDLDVARLPLEAAPELVDEDLRVRERHGEAGVDGAAGAVDVERDVLVGVVGLEME
jgi:hypothetical protein